MAEEVKPQTTAQPQPVAEKQTNCPACNKPIRKLKRYYRNGKFYCSKECWRSFVKSQEKNA